MTTVAMTFDSHWEIIESCVGVINSNFCCDYDAHTLFFGIYSCSRERIRPFEPSNHATYYDQIMLTITSQRLHREGISYQPPMLYMWVDPLEPSSEHMI